MKRLLIATLVLLGAAGAFAADDVLQIPTDGTGKKLDASSLPVGANTVYRQRVNVADPTDGNRIAHVTASGELKVECTGCSAASVVSVAHIASVTHVAAAGAFPVAQSGAWAVNVGHIAGAVHLAGGMVDNANAALRVTAVTHTTITGTIGHVSSTTHVAGQVQLASQAGVLATLTGTSLNVNCTGGCAGGTQTPVNQSGEWTIQAAHQAGTWNIGHISSALHIAGGIIAATQSGAWTVSANAGTGSLTVNQGGAWAASAHQAGAWAVNIAHIASAVHIAGTVPVSGTVTANAGTGTFTVAGTVTANAGTGSLTVNQGGAWTVGAAHQAGAWNINHQSSTVHVAGTVQANRGSGQLTCHSTAAFAQSASGILVHAAGANRLFICGIVLVAAHANVVSLVEGTGVDCATGTTPVIGSSTAANGLAFNQNQGFASVSAFPWIATQTAGNNLCLLVNNAARVTGTISYGGAP